MDVISRFRSNLRIKQKKISERNRFFHDEYGLTSTGVVLALLITLALLMSSAQVYKVNTLSAEVQNVADAAALAAENQVAEYMIIVKFCDAALLSMSLCALVTTGLGIAALCTPFTAPLGEKLISASKKVLDARKKFFEQSTKSLKVLQNMLPFFAAASAVHVCIANNTNHVGADYIGIALLAPGKGTINVPDTSELGQELVRDVDYKAEQIKEKGKAAEEAAQKSNEAKQRAFMHDCGNAENYCMYERSRQLAHLEGGDNPFFSSIDTWTFEIALNRAKKYYEKRLAIEEPLDNTSLEISKSQLRKDFYEYASRIVSEEGFVHEDLDSFEAKFPLLPKNTDEMRNTSLYEIKRYPVTLLKEQEEEKLIVHSWEGCPGIGDGIVGHESIKYMEESNLQECPYCEFSATSFGKVAAATSSIETGFEYHYRIVAEEAERYQKERNSADDPKREVKEIVGNIFNQIKEGIKIIANQRIYAQPPGSYGSIAFVINKGHLSSRDLIPSPFISKDVSLKSRAAISGSTLVAESSEEGKDVINSLLDTLRRDGSVLGAAGGLVLDIWSGMLRVYSNGYSALTDGLQSVLDSIPFVGASGLGSWVKTTISTYFEDCGLEPVKVNALKPVLINTGHIASKEDKSLSKRLITIKKAAIEHSFHSRDIFGSLLTDAEQEAISKIEGMGDSLTIASIELLGIEGMSIPIIIPIPEQAKQFATNSIEDLFNNIRDARAQYVEVRVWE